MCTLHVKIWDFCQVLGLKQYRVPPNSHFKLYCHLLYASLTMLVYVGVRLIASSCLNSICKQAHRLTHLFSPGRSHENTYYITPKKKTKTRGIDTQKWTLAFICYAHFWRAYNTQFSRAYDKKFVGMHMIRSFRVHMIRIYTTTLTLPIA